MLRIVRDQSLSESLPPAFCVCRRTVNESTRQYFSRLHALQLDVLHDSSERDFETVFADLAPIARRGPRNPPRRILDQPQ